MNNNRKQTVVIGGSFGGINAAYYLAPIRYDLPPLDFGW